MNPRPKGVWTYKSPFSAIADEAKKHQKQERLRLQTQRAERAARPVPNYICYPEAFKLYDPKTGRWHGGRLPKCRVCECTLQPTENHKCPGFTPKYVEHNEEWHERWEQRRQEIREARLEEMRENRNSHHCDDCGAELHDEEDAIAHAEDCPAREEWDGDLEGDSVYSGE